MTDRAKPARKAAPLAAPGEAAPAARATSSSGSVVEEILTGLYDGRYVPGQRLIEADLTRHLKVSRGSVREALSRLSAEGVVKLTLHRGAYIRTLTRAEVRGVLEVTEIIVGLAARLAPSTSASRAPRTSCARPSSG